MAGAMKCGICGKTERIMFETNWGYGSRSKSYQRRGADGEFIKQYNDDGSVRMKPIFDASEMSEHKRFEHPQEVAQADVKRRETKERNERAKELKHANMSKVSIAGQEAVAFPVLNFDEHWQYRTNLWRAGRGRGNSEASPHQLNTSRTSGYEADHARAQVRAGHGDETVFNNGAWNFRQITDADVAELTALDEQIKELQESRNAIAAQMYERGTELTNQHIADLGDADRAATEEFERMLSEGDELEGMSADDGKLTDADVESIVEAAMANHPTKFISYSKEQVSESLSAYGY